MQVKRMLERCLSAREKIKNSQRVPMNELEQLLSIMSIIKKSGDYSLFANIPTQYLKPEAERNKLIALMNKRIHKKRNSTCLFPGCNDIPIQSHSLQKSLLKAIADSTNHVKKIGVNVEFKLNGKFSVLEENIGINKASTFAGFCNKHDTEIFKSIESNIIDYNNQEHLFLLLYRSIAREYFEVNKNYFLMRDVVNDLLKNIEESDMLGPCLLIQLYWQYCEYFYIEEIKRSADICLTHKIWDNNYQYYHMTLDKSVPIFLNTFFAVQGTNCDIIYRKDITKEFPLFCSVTMLMQNDKTEVFYAIPKEQYHELRAFIKQFQNTNIDELELFLSDLIIRNSDNFFISPDYWSKIPSKIQNKILEIFKKTINDREYIYSDKINLFEYV